MANHSRKLAKALDLSKLTSDGCDLVFNKTDDDYAEDETFDIEHDYNVDEAMKFARLDLLDVEEAGSALTKYKYNMIPVPYMSTISTRPIEDNKLMKRIKEEGKFNYFLILGYV